MTKIAEMRATYLLPRRLASSGFFVQKSSWHQSKCTWLRISLVILQVTKRQPVSHLPPLSSIFILFFMRSSKKMLILRWQELSSRVLLHELPYLWSYRSTQICRTLLQLLKDVGYWRTSTATIQHLLKLFILRQNTEKRWFGPLHLSWSPWQVVKEC